MTQDLIKTPVTVVEEMNVWRMLDADGETVTITGNADPTQINRLAHTLNVLSGKLSGDPNGTATKEERELWRRTAIAWSNKVENCLISAIDALERVVDGGELLRSQCSDGTDVADILDSFVPEAKVALEESRLLLSIGENGKDNRAEVKRKLSCL